MIIVKVKFLEPVRERGRPLLYRNLGKQVEMACIKTEPEVLILEIAEERDEGSRLVFKDVFKHDGKTFVRFLKRFGPRFDAGIEPELFAPLETPVIETGMADEPSAS